jgi:hypothetical protein
MFEEPLKTVNEDISTVRSIIRTNEKLREIIFREGIATGQDSQNNEELISLREIVLNEKNWRVYDHCSVVTRLYAIYESFVESSIRDWIIYLPKIFPRYSVLPEVIQGTYQIGVAKLLLKKNESRSEDLSFEKVVRRLFLAVSDDGSSYKLIPDAFLLHEQNLRKEALEKLFADAGIPEVWSWVKQHRKVKDFVEKVLADENTAEGELKELIGYRNNAAHGGIIYNVLGERKLLDLCDFVKVLCQALAELVTYSIVEQQKSIGQVKKIGQITEWFSKPEAGVAKVTDTELSVGESLFLVSQTKAYCQQLKIESIKITANGEEIDKEQISITSETEVGLKFDRNARKDLSLYKSLIMND